MSVQVLVLGATGFIGGQIVRAAHEAGMQVHGLRRRPAAVGAVGDLPVIWHEGDLADDESLYQAMRGCEVLFHAAGYAPRLERHIPRAARTAVEEMRRVLDAARRAGVSRVVYTSSLSTIGSPPPGEGRLADERDGYLPGTVHSSYYEAKWHMEHEALRATLDGLPVVILCPTAVFGPGDVKPSTSELVLRLAKRQLPLSVDVEVNIVDGRDVALAHIRAVSLGQPGERYIIGGHNMNVRDAMQRAAAVIGVRPPRRTLSVAAVQRLIRAADVLRLPLPETMRALPHWQPLNAEKAHRVFGLTPRPYEETIRDTVGWFRENGYL
ncbi:MAG: NAD-dependent epimerase/dehydratase family protein [Anaerolineae bacterium]